MAEPLGILITGGGGQLGLELQALPWPQPVRLHAPSRAELELGSVASVRSYFERKSFAAVINAGAYTGVDAAEDEAASAFAANALGPAVLAEVTRQTGAPLVQVSTDYVFDGSKPDFYVEDDPVAPLGVYGASKVAGELAVRSGNPRSVVLRTAWIVSRRRSNFLTTMLRLAVERPVVRVVNDQRGCPTSARDVAEALQTITLAMIADRDAPTGVYHFVNAGEATWADLAREIFSQSAQSGGPAAEVQDISSSEYPSRARRPMNSRLATGKLTRDYGVIPRDWRAAVAEIVSELQAEGIGE